MIEISAKNERKDGFELSIHVEGNGSKIASELVAIFDYFYKSAPELFERALLASKYTEDHT